MKLVGYTYVPGFTALNSKVEKKKEKEKEKAVIKDNGVK
jgi:hypothetical protein